MSSHLGFDVMEVGRQVVVHKELVHRPDVEGLLHALCQLRRHQIGRGAVANQHGRRVALALAEELDVDARTQRTRARLACARVRGGLPVKDPLDRRLVLGPLVEFLSGFGI